MSTEISIHAAQTTILRELLFVPTSGYAQLQKPTGLTSDHFNFHINRLSQLGLVERVSKGQYQLSLAGKEYANKIDTENNTIERQPKSAVMLAVTRTQNGVTEYLIQERVKNPNYGFFGFPTGKIKWGETILQAANRECKEETGLHAEFEVVGTYHEHVRFEENNELVEDKIFFMCKSTQYSGAILKTFEGGRNQWLTLEQLLSKDKKFKSLEHELKLLQSDAKLLEKTIYYSKDSF